MKLEFDYTLLVQFAQVLILLILLHFLAFKPVLRALSKRQDTIQSLAGRAEGGAHEVETLGRTYDEGLKAKKLPILQQRDTLLKENHEASMKVIEEARRDLTEELAKVKDGVKNEVGKAMENLKGQSDVFVAEIVQKIMKRGA
jgi:F-type H+-transporting ATPase subunit b